MKVIITTVPFGEIDNQPIKLLQECSQVEYSINPLGRKLKKNEVADVIGGADIVIAGTEPITEDVMMRCPNLKAICRVGIGLDSVDLVEARRRGIKVSYTPNAPSAAVAELTIGHMIDQLRGISLNDRNMRNNKWHRSAGRRLATSKIGIIGCGRIGLRVINHLLGGFPGVEIFANDVSPIQELNDRVKWCDKEEIYKNCDVISLHLPLTPESKNIISAAEIALMKSDAIIINTARGGVVNETDLAIALENGILKGAAIDVFEEEPYFGDFCELENTVLTPHLGSMTADCRSQMEVEATQEAIRFVMGENFLNPVPKEEYELADRMSKEKVG